MVVIQSIPPAEYCGNCPDYILDSDVSLEFEVRRGKQALLQELYSPDAANTIRVRDLGRLCGLALWGDLQGGWQTHHADRFDFCVDGTLLSSSILYYSRHNSFREPRDGGLLSSVNVKATAKGWTEYTTGLLPSDSRGPFYTLRAYKEYLPVAEQQVYVPAMPTDYELPYTVETSVASVQRELQVDDFDTYEVDFGNNNLMRYQLLKRIPHQVQRLRFRNDFDLPETLIATGGLSLEVKNQDESAVMAGREQRVSVSVQDEWTIHSGPFYHRSDIRLWRELIHSTQIQLLAGGNWIDIYPVKHKMEQSEQTNQVDAVTLTFRVADSSQSYLIV